MRIPFTINILVLSAMLFAGCAAHPPTEQELKVINGLQGKWEGKLFENGWWHVFSDKSGDTGSSGTLIFNGQKVRFSYSNLINPLAPSPEVGRRYSGEATETFTVDGDEIIVTSYRGARNHHNYGNFSFRLIGQDNLEGYRADFPALIWKFHRVVTSPPTIEDMKNLKGRWIGKMYNNSKHPFGDSNNGEDTGISGALAFNNQTVSFSGDGTINNNVIKRSGFKYTRDYYIEDGKVVFPSGDRLHEMVFWFTGPDSLKGQRNDSFNIVWDFKRVEGD